MTVGRIQLFTGCHTKDFMSLLAVSWKLLLVPCRVCHSIELPTWQLASEKQRDKEFASKTEVRIPHNPFMEIIPHHLCYIPSVRITSLVQPAFKERGVYWSRNTGYRVCEDHLPHLSNNNSLFWLTYFQPTVGWKKTVEKDYRQISPILQKEGHKIQFHDSQIMIVVSPECPHICRNEGYSLREILFLANSTLGLPCNLFPPLLLINCFILPFTMRNFNPWSKTHQFLGKSLLIHSSHCWFHR